MLDVVKTYLSQVMTYISTVITAPEDVSHYYMNILAYPSLCCYLDVPMITI
jgi:hypothetical protein